MMEIYHCTKYIRKKEENEKQQYCTIRFREAQRKGTNLLLRNDNTHSRETIFLGKNLLKQNLFGEAT